MMSRSFECCILGAGPAGFGAAVELVKHGVRNIVIIDRNNVVGGLARTESFGGARFDVGPHRFYTKNQEVNKLWHDTLGKDFIAVDRLTRIYYKNKYFNYPLKAGEALLKLGPIESTQAIFSFLASKASLDGEAVTLEDWVTQKFGRKLYETFFKTYTEKVWGIPCDKIGAEWAAQRIKGLDVFQVIKNALFGNKKKIKTLVDQFDYPVMGAGMMYEAMARKCADSGAELMLGAKITGFRRNGYKITAVDVMQRGEQIEVSAGCFFNSIPLTHFIKAVRPSLGPEIIKSADALYYREHITVDLLIDGVELFPDQWIYIHSPDVRIARLANYNNFSKSMAPAGKTALSAEYFTFQNEELWQKTDDDLKQLAIDELKYMGLIDPKKVEQCWVVRETESYPTYYLGFKEHYDVLRGEIDRFENLMPIGRGGLYKYNNQDHATYSGMLAARNYLKLPGSPYNVWNINIDAEYVEGGERVSPAA